MIFAFGAPEIGDVILYLLLLGFLLLILGTIFVSVLSFGSAYAFARKRLGWSRKKSVLLAAFGLILGLIAWAVWLNS